MALTNEHHGHADGAAPGSHGTDVATVALYVDDVPARLDLDGRALSLEPWCHDEAPFVYAVRSE